MTLDELGVKHGTDKSSLRHGYLPLYEQHLGVRRDEPLTLLELGVFTGSSLRMWRDWMPNATIIGLDRQDPIDVPGCTIVRGEQDDPNIINRIAEHGPFDVIIDDASHLSSKTIRSFQLLYPHLAPGGVYVIEDLHASYWPAIYGYDEANPNPDDITHHTVMAFCKRLADEVNFNPYDHPPEDSCRQALYPRKYWRGYHLASVSFHYGICFIQKHPDADH